MTKKYTIRNKLSFSKLQKFEPSSNFLGSFRQTIAFSNHTYLYFKTEVQATEHMNSVKESLLEFVQDMEANPFDYLPSELEVNPGDYIEKLQERILKIAENLVVYMHHTSAKQINKR